MSDDKTYNGWTNYETWATNLWIDNDESLQNEAREQTRNARENPEKNVFCPGGVREVRFTLADAIKRWVTDGLLPDLGACLAADLLGAAVSEVNWLEIADSWLTNWPTDETED